MPRKDRQTPEHRLTLDVVRTYRSRFNNARETAKAFGVSERTMRRWLVKIAQGQDPLKREGLSATYSERRKTAEEYLRGDVAMQHLKTQYGPRVAKEHYKLELGKGIPDTEITRKAYGFQVYMKGRGVSGGQMTTIVTGRPEDAINAARALMRKYARFRGTEFVLTAFVDIRRLESTP